MQHAHVNEILDERAQFNRMKKEIEELKKTLEQSKNSDLNSELQLTNEQLEAEKKKNEDLLKKLKDQFLSSTQLWQSGDRFLAPAPGGNNFAFLGLNLKFGVIFKPQGQKFVMKERLLSERITS